MAGGWAGDDGSMAEKGTTRKRLIQSMTRSPEWQFAKRNSKAVVQVADSPQAFAAAPAVSTQSTEDFGVWSSNISLRRKSKEALFYNLQIRHNELCKI